MIDLRTRQLQLQVSPKFTHVEALTAVLMGVAAVYAAALWVVG